MTRIQKNLIKYIKILALLHHKSLADLNRRFGRGQNYIESVVQKNSDELPNLIPYLLPSIYNEIKLGDMGPFDDIIQQTSAKVHDYDSFYLYLRVLACIKFGSLSRVCTKLGLTESYLHTVIERGDARLNGICKKMARVMHLNHQFLTLPLKQAE